MKNYKKDLNIPGRAVVATAKELQKRAVEVTLSTGVRAKIKTVAASLIDRVTSRIPEPVVPMEPNPDKEGRLEPNPLSPEYISAVKQYNKARGEAAINAAIMFGIQLLDPIPDSSEWLDQLKFLEKQGELDLSKYDLENDIDLEYLYKAFVAMGFDDIKLVMASASIPTEAMDRAAESFQREDEQLSDPTEEVEG